METGLSSLTRINKPQARHAARVLGRAFENYNLWTYYYPDPAKRRKVIYYLCAFNVYYGIRFGEVYSNSPAMEGIAVWLPSAYYHMGIWNVLRAVPLNVQIGFILSGGLKMVEAGEHVDNLHKKLAPFDHWYLSGLGVDTPLQGRGYASRLLRPFLERADQEKLPCYLETNDEKDVAIYCHLGFKILDESLVPHTPVKNWSMLREVGASGE